MPVRTGPSDEAPPTIIPNPESLPPIASTHQKLAAELKPESVLDTLPAERRKELYDLLEEFGVAPVLRHITRPQPEGWGIQTSETSLRRFVMSFRKSEEERLEKINHKAARAAAEAAQRILSDPDATEEQIVAAADRILHLRLLESAKNFCGARYKEFQILYQSHLRRLALQLGRERLAYLNAKLAPSTASDADASTQPTKQKEPSTS